MQDRAHSFGYWLRRRRKALDLTQDALAQRVSCSAFSIRKIEADERRPSRRLAERLAVSLAIPEEERRDFLDAARAVRAANRLPLDAMPLATDARAAAPGPSIHSPLDSAIGSTSDTTPFVGRSNEYSLLTGLIAQLMAGTGHTVLIEGESGIGKSRLMREVARYADAHGLPTLATNCHEIERATPYQPVIDLVTRALDRAPAAALRNLAPVSLAELAALVPEVGERFPGLPRLSNDFPEARQARLPGAVEQLLAASSGGRPSILMVDDIQWADDASAQVLHYLARHAAQRPVLVIYAYRDEEVDSDERLARLVESLRRDTDARHVFLARLGYSDTESLVAALAEANRGVPGLAERLHRESEGNPFFLMSILQSLSEGETQPETRARRTGIAPGRLACRRARATRARAQRAPADARNRRGPRPALRLRYASRRDTRARGAAARRDGGASQAPFAARGTRGRRIRFQPRQGTRGGLSRHRWARRRLLHQSVADTLERRGEGETPERDAQLAEHYERAHVWSKALRYLVLAGEHAQTLFAMREALHWWDRAVALVESYPESLDESQRIAIYERRGAARAQAGQTQGAVADIRRVVDAARAGGEREKTRDALVQLGMAYRRADSYEEATACLTEALAESRAMNDERHAADTLYHLGTVAWSTGLNDQAIGFHQQAVEICERTGIADIVAVQAYHGRGEAHFANAEPAAAIECYTRSIELARGIGDKGYESENLMMIGHACVGTKGLGSYPRAMANLEAALEIARAADLQWHIGPTLLGIDHVRACTGRYGEAWSGMQETLRWLESLGQTRYQLIAHDFIGHLLLDLGLNELAVEHMEHGLALGRNTGIMFWRAAIDAHVAIARSRLGQKDVAPTLQATLEQTRRTSERYLMVRCIEALAEISLAAGDASRCRAYGDELLAIAEANGLRELEASARRWRGQALLAEKVYDEAQAELSRAAALAKDIGRVRLQMDAEAALARLPGVQSGNAAAQRHAATARAIADAIEKSLVSSGLDARLRTTGDAH